MVKGSRLKATVTCMILATTGFCFQNCGSGLSPHIQTPQNETVPLSLRLPTSIESSVQDLNKLASEKGSRLLHGSIFANPRIINEGRMNSEWLRVREKFRLFVQQSRYDSSVLYDAQMELSNFVQYAFERNKVNWLHDLMSAYLEAYPALNFKSDYIFSYPQLHDGATPSRAKLPLSRAYPMWLDSKDEEVILTSAQFLYPITLILYWIETTGAANSDQVAKDFSEKFSKVATDHVKRWVLKEGSIHGIFQVNGWGCNPGTFSHIEHLEHLKARRYGSSYFSIAKNFSYCNLVSDTDLFILSDVMHILAAHKVNPGRYDLSIGAVRQLHSYLLLGVELFKSRITRHTALDFKGQIVPTVNFDLGAFDDYGDYQYAGDSLLSFPGWTSPNTSPSRSPKPSTKIGWDISHARRFVLFLFSLREFGVPQGIVAARDLAEIEIGMANQLAYVVFNKNFEAPAFSNFMDGTNGWFRVNYEGRSSFGYEPWSKILGESIVLGGFGFWGRFNPDINRIITIYAKKLKSDQMKTFHLLQIYAVLAMR